MYTVSVWIIFLLFAAAGVGGVRVVFVGRRNMQQNANTWHLSGFNTKLNNFTSFLMPYLSAITKINKTKKHNSHAHTHSQKIQYLHLYLIFSAFDVQFFYSSCPCIFFPHFILFVVIILLVLPKYVTSLHISNGCEWALALTRFRLCIGYIHHVCLRARVCVCLWQFGIHLMCGDVEHFTTFRVYKHCIAHSEQQRQQWRRQKQPNEMNSTKKTRMKQKQPSAICLHRLFVPTEKKRCLRYIYVIVFGQIKK